jgi:hypothetical protein
MSKMKGIILLFILLVVTILTGILFGDFLFVEGFHSSSATQKGKGIGDSYAAPLDLVLNTDNTTFSGKMQSVNQNGLDDMPTFLI